MVNQIYDNFPSFLKTGSAAGAGLVLGTPTLWAQDKKEKKQRQKPKTNLLKFRTL